MIRHKKTSVSIMELPKNIGKLMTIKNLWLVGKHLQNMKKKHINNTKKYAAKIAFDEGSKE